MKKRVLFLVDYWHPKQTANAVCVKNVAKALQKKGWEVFVSAYHNEAASSMEDEGIHISFVKPTWARQCLSKAQWSKDAKKARLLGTVGSVLNKTRRLLLLPVYPIVSVSFAKRWSKQCSKLIKEYKVDYVVSVMAPDDALYTGYLVKKQNPHISWSAYYIDAGTNVLPGSSFEKLKSCLHKKAVKWENKVLQRADRILVMKGHESYYRKSLDSQNEQKLAICDVPLFDPDTNSWNGAQPINAKGHCETWVYTGNMSGSYYDPHGICGFFEEYKKHKKAELHLYGPSDFRSYLNDLTQDAHSGIIWHGMVSREEAQIAQQNADVLLFYLNRELDSVSGKLFEYIKSGKPVIYFGDTSDINAMHLTKYPRGLAVDSRLAWGDQVQVVQKFLENIPCGILSFEELLDRFSLSLPDTTAEVFERLYSEMQTNKER